MTTTKSKIKKWCPSPDCIGKPYKIKGQKGKMKCDVCGRTFLKSFIANYQGSNRKIVGHGYSNNPLPDIHIQTAQISIIQAIESKKLGKKDIRILRRAHKLMQRVRDKHREKITKRQAQKMGLFTIKF